MGFTEKSGGEADELNQAGERAWGAAGQRAVAGSSNGSTDEQRRVLVVVRNGEDERERKVKGAKKWRK